MSRVLRTLALLSMAVMSTACDVDCTDYTNSTVAAGTVQSASGATLGTANLGLYDNVQRQEFHLLFTLDAPFGSGGAPLKGHVLSGRLLLPSGEVLLELDPTVPSPVMQGVINHFARVPTQEALAALREAMLTGNVRMVIETDLPGNERIEARLSAAAHYPYVKRSCPRYS